MRKQILFLIIMTAAITIILIFMAQNTRYESNSIVCSHPKNVFEVTYSHLENGAQLSFEKNNEILKTYEINSLEGSIFKFDDNTSNYTFDLSKKIELDTIGVSDSVYTRLSEELFDLCLAKNYKYLPALTRPKIELNSLRNIVRY